MFNSGKYYERLQTGEFTADISDQGPARHLAGYRSQIIAYLDQAGKTVAIVHQYGNEWGDAAPGTLPDPKFLFEKGTRYRVDPDMT